MNGYIEINEINIPLKKTDDSFEWELALVVGDYVYYTQDEGYEIALMYRMRFGNLFLVSNNYFAYASMMDEIEDIMNKNKKPLFISGELVKELADLGGN